VVAVALASAVSTVLSNGKVLDTIAYSMSSALRSMPKSFFAPGMFLAQCLINCVIPSASGKAAATMPIMVPLGDVLGLNRHITVLSFQFGDCLTNSVTPASGFFMAGLAMCKIKWTTWLKWYWKLLLMLFVLYSIMLIIATALPNYPSI
jgi:uncharacterized ion transporter superfamily protein YfcC